MGHNEREAETKKKEEGGQMKQRGKKIAGH
jgi:hypothetical protein